VNIKDTSDPETLKAQRDFHKRNLTISGICMAVWYSLNLIDAAVDAHLFDFNMSDDPAMHWEPTLVNPYSPPAHGHELWAKAEFTIAISSLTYIT
jgi:hypothetical protein